MSVTVDEQAEIICGRCGEKFKPKRSWQKFCSTPCRQADWDGRNPRQRVVTEQLQRIETKLDELLK